jgi:ATP:cob(I)alamin adenosyltransferase
MKIYTKTGDQGQTSLTQGLRVDKDDVRIEANGELDELNAILGIVKSLMQDD